MPPTPGNAQHPLGTEAVGLASFNGYAHLVLRDSRDGPSNEEWVSGDADRAWHQYQDLCFQVGAELSAEKQTALREDYKLTPGQVLTLRTKQALAFYCERELLEKGFVRCDEHALTASPHSLDEADLRRED